MQFTMKIPGIHKKFRSENLYERDHVRNPGIGGRILLKWILKERGVWK
jgi:hypothetical protein